MSPALCPLHASSLFSHIRFYSPPPLTFPSRLELFAVGCFFLHADSSSEMFLGVVHFSGWLLTVLPLPSPFFSCCCYWFLWARSPSKFSLHNLPD